MEHTESETLQSGVWLAIEVHWMDLLTSLHELAKSPFAIGDTIVMRNTNCKIGP